MSNSASRTGCLRLSSIRRMGRPCHRGRGGLPNTIRPASTPWCRPCTALRSRPAPCYRVRRHKACPQLPTSNPANGVSNMDFRLTPEQEQFRGQVQTFIKEQLPPGWEDRMGDGEGGSDAAWDLSRRFTFRLAEKQWLAMAWPVEYGGLGADHMTQMLYNEQMAYHRAPGGGGMGVAWVGPAVMLYGTDEQKQQYIPRITSGEDVWCT